MTAQTSFPALGGTGVVITTEEPALRPAAAAVLQVVESFDRACSRFREDSELSTVNRAAGRPVRVGPVLLEAVSAALRAAELTAGDVDPTLGASLVALGYDRDFELGLDGRGEQGAGPRLRVTATSSWRAVSLDLEGGTVTLPRGVQLDLGATAKALAADRAAVAAREAAGGCGVLVGLAGDLATAGPAPPGGWRVRVTDDHRASLAAPGQWVVIESGGLATSSTTTRRWRTASGEPAHHLLDPRTGRPLRSPWRTASVAAASSLDANIAATAAIVRGEQAADWLTGARLPSRLVDQEGSVRHVAGWPAEGEELPPAPAGRLLAPAGARA